MNDLFSNPTTTAAVVGGIDLIAMLMSAFFAWIMSVGSFVIAFFSELMRPSKEHGYDSYFLLKLFAIPFLYLLAGVFVHEIIRIFLEFWYKSDLHQTIINFYNFELQNYNIENVSDATKDIIEKSFTVIKGVFLGSAVLIYSVIILFYGFVAFQYLRVTEKQKQIGRYSPFAKIFFSFVVVVIGYISATTYDKVTSSVMLPSGVTISNIGEVHSLHEIVKKEILWSAKQSLNITN
jgi:hypothetical protein